MTGERRAVAEPADDPDHLLALGQALLDAGRPLKALLPLARARALAPEREAIWRAELEAREAVLGTPLAPEHDYRREARARFPRADWLVGPPAPRHELGVELGRSRLDGGYDDWRSVTLQFEWRRAGVGGWRAGVEQSSRFRTRDTTAFAALSAPLVSNWRGGARVAVTPGADFRPSWSGALALERGLSTGIGVGMEVRYADYADTYAAAFGLPLTWRYDAWRLRYTPAMTRVGDAEGSFGHRVELRLRTGERAYLGVGWRSGREPERRPDAGVRSADVRGVSVRARHDLNQRIGMTWTLAHTRREGAYERWSLVVGLRYRL